MTKFDCVIIGGGQSGLCAAKKLIDQNLQIVVLERFNVGNSWMKRPEKMFLFTSRKYNRLPGLAFPGKQMGFPSTEDMFDYLTGYAQHFKIPVRENSNVVSVAKESVYFKIELENGDVLKSRSIVNATGSNQVCNVPDMAEKLSAEVEQYVSETRKFDDITDSSAILVVGGGASGRQIAGRLSARCSNVVLSTGSSRGLPPNKILGLDIFWWLSKLGVLFADKNSVIARILKKRNPVPCKEFNDRNLQKMGVGIKGRTQKCEDKTITFIDGSEMEVDVVIWAIGYIEETKWLDIDSSVSNDEFEEQYGVCPEPGLFMVGRKWLSCRASELIMGAEHDVNLIVPKLTEFLKTNG